MGWSLVRVINGRWTSGFSHITEEYGNRVQLSTQFAGIYYSANSWRRRYLTSTSASRFLFVTLLSEIPVVTGWSGCMIITRGTTTRSGIKQNAICGGYAP